MPDKAEKRGRKPLPEEQVLERLTTRISKTLKRAVEADAVKDHRNPSQQAALYIDLGRAEHIKKHPELK